MACRNSVRTAQLVNSGLAFSQFESFLWVCLGTPDAHRPTVERVDRSPHRRQTAINTTLSDSQCAHFSELLRRDPPHDSLMTQPLCDLSVHRWQSTTTPIGPRGKKGRVGDPVWAGCDDVAALDTSENSWPT